MALCCTVCGEWSPCLGGDRLDICDECRRMNFAGSQELLAQGPTAREALDAYVSSAHQMTPRQAQAMARLHQRWEAEAQRRVAGEDT